MNTRTRTGRWGEELVAAALAVRGWNILDRNWRPDPRESDLRGELDIVASDRGRLVVCEVKTRSSLDFGHPLESIGRDKSRRLCLLGKRWAEESGLFAADLRVDAVAVVGSPRAFSLEHREGVL